MIFRKWCAVMCGDWLPWWLCWISFQIRVQVESESTMTQKWSHVKNSGSFHTNVFVTQCCQHRCHHVRHQRGCRTFQQSKNALNSMTESNYRPFWYHFWALQSEHSALLSGPIWSDNPWEQTVIFTLTFSLTHLRARSLTWTWPPRSSSVPVPVSCSVLCPVPVAENPRWSLLAASSALPLRDNTDQHLKLLFADTSHRAFVPRCFRNKLEEENCGTHEYKLLLLVRQECVLASHLWHLPHIKGGRDSDLAAALLSPTFSIYMNKTFIAAANKSATAF